jgi:hypothetical protein
MRQLIVAGLMYLIVTAIVLTIKPTLMFTSDGAWKEFGIGRNPLTHTWMPFWLFAVLSALICYILVVLVFAMYNIPGNMETPTIPNLTAKGTSRKNASPATPEVNMDFDNAMEVGPEDLMAEVKVSRASRLRGKAAELPEGYYVLNTAATDAAGGVPKYIYLGKGLPTD